MLRTGAQYLDGIRDGREVYVAGERVRDVTAHPALAPIVAARARIYDMAHEAALADTLGYADGNARHSIFNRLPLDRRDPDMMVRVTKETDAGTRQTGLEKLQSVQEKLADLVCSREGIRAHLEASIALIETSPARPAMPNQSILYAGRVLACSQLTAMMHCWRSRATW